MSSSRTGILFLIRFHSEKDYGCARLTNQKSSWCHPEVFLKSSWSHPEVIMMSSWCHHDKSEAGRWRLCTLDNFVPNGRTDTQTKWLTGLLSEAKTLSFDTVLSFAYFLSNSYLIFSLFTVSLFKLFFSPKPKIFRKVFLSTKWFLKTILLLKKQQFPNFSLSYYRTIQCVKYITIYQR